MRSLFLTHKDKIGQNRAKMDKKLSSGLAGKVWCAVRVVWHTLLIKLPRA